jgi:hypothetical protein
VKYRVHTCLAFDDVKVATAFLEAIKKDYLSSSVSINEDKNTKEISSCYIEECHHDEVPPKPCVVLEKWEVKTGAPVNTIVAAKVG